MDDQQCDMEEETLEEVEETTFSRKTVESEEDSDSRKEEDNLENSTKMEELAMQLKEKEEKIISLRKEMESLDKANDVAKLSKEHEVQLKEKEDKIVGLRKEVEVLKRLVAERDKVIENLKQTKKIDDSKQYKQKIDELQSTVTQLEASIPKLTAREGWLQKLTSKGRFVNRFIVLRTNILLYYHNTKNLKKPAGVVDLNDSEVQELPSDGKKKNCFSIITELGEVYTFMAPTREEFDYWLQGIEQVRFKSKTPKSTTSKFPKEESPQETKAKEKEKGNRRKTKSKDDIRRVTVLRTNMPEVSKK